MSTKLVQSKFVIESISIESFRGYNKSHSFTFKEPVSVFFGRNGHGKSSTLYAIEWCLFGKIEFLPSLEGRARDEIVNQFNHTGLASVRMVLKRGKEEVTIERTKETGSANTSFAITTKEGRFEDGEAERKFFSLFGMTLGDFIRAVYLHQEAIRALLTDDMAQRDEALDRLFGLETMRNIVSGIPIKDIKDKIETLEGKKESLTNKIAGAIAQCQEDLRKLKKKAADANLAEDDLNISYASKNANTIIEEINAISKDYSVENPEIGEPKSLSDFSAFQSKAKKTIKEFEKGNVDQTQVSELGSKKRRIEGLVEDVQKQEKPVKELEQQISKIVNVEGDLDAIGKKILTVQEQLTVANKKRDSLDINSKLIQDAIASLKILQESVCPVCS